MKELIRRINGLFISGVLAAFYVLAVGISFLMLKLRDLIKEKEQKGWREARPLDEDFSSPY